MVQLAYLKLGNQNQYYNGNTTEQQKIASILFDTIIDEIAMETIFLFNAVTVKLNKNLDSSDGEYFRFNLPVDFLSKVRCSDRLARFEGEYIYSTSDTLELTYCRELPLSEYPDYLSKYITIELAVRLSDAYRTLADNKQLLMLEKQTEVDRISTLEGLPFTIPR
ncbi:hypothetical protein [Cetobacterium sp.]|uniref:hypothetical protein n=1 Tax=Cetobacterium sp. TaxID=2071632 RepID=UPI003F681994